MIFINNNSIINIIIKWFSCGLGVPVVIKNLDLDVDDKFLRERFSSFGQISKITITPDNQKIRSATIFYMSPAEALRAISHMNGARLLSKVIYAGLDNPQIKRQRKSLVTYRNLFSKTTNPCNP